MHFYFKLELLSSVSLSNLVYIMLNILVLYCFCFILFLIVFLFYKCIFVLCFVVFMLLFLFFVVFFFVFIPCHTIVVGYYGIPSSVCPSVCTLLPDNSSYSFHWIALKLTGSLDHEVVQRIYFEVTVYQI